MSSSLEALLSEHKLENLIPSQNPEYIKVIINNGSHILWKKDFRKMPAAGTAVYNHNYSILCRAFGLQLPEPGPRSSDG